MIDKDSWIAQNVFPKNDFSETRVKRLGVTSVNVFKSTRKTKFTLCVLGSWAIYMPPYNLARLSGLTREAGYPTRVFDFNVQSHYALKTANPDLADAWNGANYWWWQEGEYDKRIHPTYEPILYQYLELLLEDTPDIIGLSCYYTNILPTKWMINKIKERNPNITIILGGPECHEKYFRKPQGADYYFVGESEQNIIDFLNNWEQGIKPENEAIGSLYSDTRIDIDSLPYPDYSDFDLTKYWGKNSICAEISRGCIAKCSYCTEVYYWKFRDRGATTVVDELEYQVLKYNIGFVSFVDSLMNGNLKEFRKFCEELVERNLGISWWGYARCDGRMDLEFYKLIREAGGQGFNYGIETGSDKVLLAINKKNTVAEINQNIIDSHKVGMKVSACWVIGAPGEDIEAFNHSFNMLWNHRRRIMAVSPGPGLGDNPGSLYDDRERYNLNPRNKNWLGGWYTLDLKNTKLHRLIRIKLMHIWLSICQKFEGVVSNVHSVGDINDHFNLKFTDTDFQEEVPYENFSYNIVKSELGDFADTVMNEAFGLFRLLWRVKGGFEMTIKFNPQLDRQDFSFCIPENSTLYAEHFFQINKEGEFITKVNYKFSNNIRTIIDTPGFEFISDISGKWSDESKKIKQYKTFNLATENQENTWSPKTLLKESCLSGISIRERRMLMQTVKRLPKNSVILETNSDLGGRATIMSNANQDIIINSIETFTGNLKDQFDGMKPWLESQMTDLTSDPDGTKTFLSQIENSFKEDITGKKAWEIITFPYKNIKLFSDYSLEDLELIWNTPIDLCIIDIHQNPRLHDNLKLWTYHIKTEGLLLAHLYDTELGPDVVTEIDKLLSQGWKLVRKLDRFILIQKL